LFTAPPDVQQLAALGLSPEDYDAEAVEVWPDTEPAVRVFLLMRRQWIMGPRFPIGLNFCALREVWQRAKIHPRDRDDIFQDLLVMEAAALDQIYANSAEG